MHGFPLQFKRIRKRMHKGKLSFSTEQAAQGALVGNLKCVYLCPFCCMYHISSHEHTLKHEVEAWLVIWDREVERVDEFAAPVL